MLKDDVSLLPHFSAWCSICTWDVSSLSPLPREVPLPPTLSPAVDCSSVAQTMERKYPDLSNTVVNRTSRYPTQSKNTVTWCTVYITVFCILEYSVCQLCLMGYAAKMIDSLCSLYWELFGCWRVTRGHFDTVWQNAGDGSALGRWYLMWRQGWREWSQSVYHTSIKMIVSVALRE